MNPISERLGYFFRSKHRKGFGVHSPFVFHLVTKVIEERLPYYRYELVEKVRDTLLRTNKHLMVETKKGLKDRAISIEVKKTAKSPSYDQLLFRLVNHSKAKKILELKTSFGLSTMYMASPSSHSHVWTIEEGEKSIYARLSFGHAHFPNIFLEEGKCYDCLDRVLKRLSQVDFLFFNPDPKLYDATQMSEMYAKCEQKLHAGSVVVVDAIHRSEAARTLWQQLKADEKVRVTIDVFSYGIIYYNEELQKEDYVLRFIPARKDWFW